MGQILTYLQLQQENNTLQKENNQLRDKLAAMNEIYYKQE